jgi:hypothetical protein
MGLNLGALVGIGVGLVTGNPALGAAAGSLFGGGGGGGGGAAGGDSSSVEAKKIAFLQVSDAASTKGQQDLENIQAKNMGAAEKAAAILNGYLQEIPKDERRVVQERLHNTSMFG